MDTDKSLTLPDWLTCDIVDLLSIACVLDCILVVRVAILFFIILFYFILTVFLFLSILYFVYDLVINKCVPPPSSEPVHCTYYC